MDAFYCQVERGLNPALVGKPIVVTQYNTAPGLNVKTLLPGDNRIDVCDSNTIIAGRPSQIAGFETCLRLVDSPVPPPASTNTHIHILTPTCHAHRTITLLSPQCPTRRARWASSACPA